MKTISKSAWPLWIKHILQGKKNCEVKESGGRFYLYHYSNIWDKKRKKPKKTTKYLGTLKQACESGRILENGNVSFLLSLLSKHDVIDGLKKHFPDEWKEIMAFSLSRVIYPSPLKRTGSWVEKTTLGKYLDRNAFSGKKLSNALARVGTNVKSQSEFMRELIEDGELLLYDGSVIYSGSGYNKLLEIGYEKKEKLFLPKANIALLFSKNRNIPVHFRLFFGSVHEIKTIGSVIDELKGKDILFIADKGYYKNKLYDDLHTSHISFILPLPRDDRRIDYKTDLNGVFEYHGRIIRCTSYTSEPYFLYHYEDQYLKYEETTQYYKLKLTGKDVTFNEAWAGKITLISNKKLDPKEAYLLWKSRELIEKAFNILQNYLEADRPYVSREDVFRGYMFASFISLIAYYLVLNVLQKQGINDKVSVDDVLFEFSKVMVEDKAYPCFTEIPSKVQKLAKTLDAQNIITKIWES